jgi:hypothetical protein
MVTKSDIPTAIALGMACGTAAAQTGNGDWCSGLADVGKIHSDPGNPFLQSLSLEGVIQYQTAYIDGEDNLGNAFKESSEEFRRVRFGGRAEFLRYFTAETAVDFVMDNRFRGGELDWGFQQFETATVSIDMKRAFSVDSLDSFSLTYGTKKFSVTSEVRESSNKIITNERSAIANKVHAVTNPTGFTLSAGKSRWLVSAAIFSTEDDSDFIGGFNDGLIYHADVDYEASESLSYRLDAVVSDAAPGEDDILGYDWATSFNVIYDESPYGILATVVWGDNGAQAGGRGGSFHGLTVMPWYWFIEGKLQTVFQYSFSGSDEPSGIRANTRYLSGAQNIASVNSGRGDELHTFYLGLNWYLCAHNLKLMGGVEYADLTTPFGGVDALTYTMAVRMKF